MRNTTAACTASLVLLLLLCASGCAAQPSAQAPATPPDRDRAQAAVAQLLDAYALGSMAALADLVAPDFAPLRPAFLDAADRARSAEQAVQYETFIDRVLPRGEAVAVAFTWLKKSQTVSGQTMARGRTEFVFATGGGRWLLVRTSGDNPF